MADCASTNYFRGQGRVLMAPRDSTGPTGAWVHIGDTERLEVNVSQEFLEIQESCSGNRNTVLYTPTSSTWEVAMDAMNFSKENLARAYYGTGSDVVAGAVTNESVKAYALNTVVPLANISIKSSPAVVVTQGATTLTLNTDYTVDYTNGSITLISAANLTGSAPYTLEVDYSYNAQDNFEAVTGTQQDYAIRFEGINTVTGKAVVVHLWRVAMSLAETLSLIQTEVNRFTMSGRLLPAPEISTVGESQYMQIKIAE